MMRMKVLCMRYNQEAMLKAPTNNDPISANEKIIKKTIIEEM